LSAGCRDKRRRRPVELYLADDVSVLPHPQDRIRVAGHQKPARDRDPLERRRFLTPARPSEAALRSVSGKIASQRAPRPARGPGCYVLNRRPTPPGDCSTAKEAHARRSLGLVGVGRGADAGLAIFSRDVGTILALTEIAVLAVIALTILIAVPCGSDSTCERAFRLLRWLANRPEPPA
jgi:hypothetical protein